MMIGISPIIIFAFIIAGMMQVLISLNLIAQRVGEKAGLRGIFIGTIVGALLACPFCCII